MGWSVFVGGGEEGSVVGSCNGGLVGSWRVVV